MKRWLGMPLRFVLALAWTPFLLIISLLATSMNVRDELYDIWVEFVWEFK